MTIKYCSWATGSDTTGDGSAGNPYKSIDKASTGLTGGDEIRCAKSGDDTTLPGTMTWTNVSATVNTTSDCSGYISAKDLIRKVTLHANDYNVYWEVLSVTSSAITLNGLFTGQTESGVTTKKIGVTDTGAASSGADVQSLSASGVSPTSLLTVSGGWNLSSQLQDGKTVFWQSGTNRYGNGITLNSRNYTRISKIETSRYNQNIKLSTVLNNYIDNHISCNSTMSIIAADSTNIYIENSQFQQGGLSFASTNVGVTVINSNHVRPGTSLLGCYKLYMDNFKATGGDWWLRATDAVLLDCTFGTVRFYKDTVGMRFINSTIGVVSWYESVKADSMISMIPNATFKRYNQTKDDSRVICTQGDVKQNTAAAEFGSCMEMVPNNADYYLIYSLYGIPAIEGHGATIKIKVKKSSDFNGDAAIALYYNGEVIDGWDVLDLTTSYVEKTLECSGVPIVENGAYEIAIKVRGTVGSIYADSITVT